MLLISYYNLPQLHVWNGYYHTQTTSVSSMHAVCTCCITLLMANEMFTRPTCIISSSSYLVSFRLSLHSQGRSQDFFRGTHNLLNSVGNNCQYPPPPSPPIKTIATQGHSQTDFSDRRGKSCPFRGVGGILPQKMLKPRGSEMLFSALFMRSFFKNLF